MAPADVEEVVAEAQDDDGLKGEEGREVGCELCTHISSCFTCTGRG